MSSIYYLLWGVASDGWQVMVSKLPNLLNFPEVIAGLQPHG